MLFKGREIKNPHRQSISDKKKLFFVFTRYLIDTW